METGQGYVGTERKVDGLSRRLMKWVVTSVAIISIVSATGTAQSYLRLTTVERDHRPNLGFRTRSVSPVAGAAAPAMGPLLVVHF